MTLAAALLVLLAPSGPDISTPEDLPLSLSQWGETAPPAGAPDSDDDPSLLTHPVQGEGSQTPIPSEIWAAIQAAPESPAPRSLGQAQAPAPRPSGDDFKPPHDSVEDAYDTHFSSKAWREYVWDDYLATPQVLLPAAFAVAAGAISHWDKMLQRRWFSLLGDRGWYSDAGLYTLIGASILDGVLLPGPGRNWWDNAWTIGEANGAASLTAFVLKTGVKRPRPGAEPGTGNGTHSFPSGHSTGSFTAASLIESNSGPLFGIPSYLLAGFVAFERVEEGQHFPSDVLAGAAIGILSAGIFDSLHWGSGEEGGIARPSGQVSFQMGSLKDAQLAVDIHF